MGVGVSGVQWGGIGVALGAGVAGPMHLGIPTNF